VALRVATESQVEMLLGDAAVKRGAYAHRIPNLETTAGQGYVFGEGVTQPFRVRAGWVDDPTIKALERYVTSVDADVVPLPASSSVDSHAA
jgi:S-DNA-T family DNA segregation ATPase FtsK/SpoIIIE